VDCTGLLWIETLDYPGLLDCLISDCARIVLDDAGLDLRMIQVGLPWIDAGLLWMHAGCRPRSLSEACRSFSPRCSRQHVAGGGRATLVVNLVSV